MMMMMMTGTIEMKVQSVTGEWAKVEDGTTQNQGE